MKVLITGIAGFVGSTLARKLITEHQDIEIIGIDNLSYGRIERISDYIDEIKFINMDVKDLIDERDIKNVDVIIHCAAIAPLPDNQESPYRSIEQNVAMCGAIADFGTRIGCGNIIFFSSGALYEGSGQRACKESDNIKTNLVYPTSKYLGEQLLEALSRTYGFKTVAIRLFNLYGPNQDYFRKQPPLIGYLIKSLLEGSKPTIYGSKNAKRDYIYIDDLYCLINKIIKKFPEIDKGEMIRVNAAGGETYSVYDIISKFEEISNKEFKYNVGEKADFWLKYPRIFDRALPLNSDYLVKEVDKVAIADIEFAKQYFDWAPEVSMTEGLKNCIEFARGIIK